VRSPSSSTGTSPNGCKGRETACKRVRNPKREIEGLARWSGWRTGGGRRCRGSWGRARSQRRPPPGTATPATRTARSSTRTYTFTAMSCLLLDRSPSILLCLCAIVGIGTWNCGNWGYIRRVNCGANGCVLACRLRRSLFVREARPQRPASGYLEINQRRPAETIQREWPVTS